MSVSNQIIEVKDPPFNKDFFRTRANDAIRIFEQRRTKNAYKQLLDVLAGLYSHAYHKGRHDEKLEQKERSKATFNA